jgi:hypothetical protein
MHRPPPIRCARRALAAALGVRAPAAPRSRRATGTRSRGRWAWLAVLALAAAVVVPSSASAAGVLDQSQTTYSGGWGADMMYPRQYAQTFTAGISGSLEQVELYIAGSGDLTVKIETMVGGLPSGVAIATATVPASSVPGSAAWVTVPLSASAPISAGTEYAIVLDSLGIHYWWFGASDAGGPYAAGASLVSYDAGSNWPAIAPDQDFMFRTFVTPVDTVAPALSCAATPQFLLNQADATVTATVTDALSGPAETEVSAAADTSSVGAKTAVVTGSDNAGNEASSTCGYSVSYRFGGFAQPVDSVDADGNPVLNAVKAGQAIPLKWRLTDATGAPVTGLTSAQITVVGIACAQDTTVNALEETAAGASGLQNLGDGNYQLNWKSPKSYAGSCKRLRLDLGEGSYHTADFKFTR